jgi:3'-phosphoadenosine 5'-phosphosulfate sulfotransferase (PAPS reductase)/FAD synthetase
MEKLEKEAFIAYSQLPKFKKQVERSLHIISQALEIGSSCVSVSWGKDSIVMLHLIQQIEPGIAAINIGDSLEDLQDNYSEVSQNYCDRFSPAYTRYLYDEVKDGGFFAQIQKIYEAYPVIFVGCRAQENKRRAAAIKRFGVIHQYQTGSNAGKWRSFPLAYWSWQEVWAYICLNDLPYLRSYDHELSGCRSTSRTAVIHSFDLHRGKHQEALIRHGAITKLKVIAPEYYQLYADLYPEIKNNG